MLIRGKRGRRPDLERVLFVSDCHIPYHDKRAYELMLKVAKEFKPNHVIVLGDFIDMYTVSDHSKDPNRALKLDTEAQEAKKELARLKELGAQNNVFIAGNHEDRLTRYLQDKAPELFNIISIPHILGLDKIGFQYVPYKDNYKLGKLHVTHDCGNAGRYAVQKALDTFQKNIVLGHLHRLSYVVEGNAEGESHVGASFGWLGDSEQADYMHRVKARRDWSLGFGIGYLSKDTGFVYVLPVPIVEYTCVIGGQLFVG